MNCREMRESDIPVLEDMQLAQGYKYTLPDLRDPRLWIARRVLTNDKDVPIQAVLGRLTSEAMFLFYPGKDSDMKVMRRFLSLHQQCCDAGRVAGVDSVHCWLPPDVADKFGSQLERLGWKEYTWRTFCKGL